MHRHTLTHPVPCMGNRGQLIARVRKRNVEKRAKRERDLVDWLLLHVWHILCPFAPCDYMHTHTHTELGSVCMLPSIPASISESDFLCSPEVPLSIPPKNHHSHPMFLNLSLFSLFSRQNV